MSAEGRDGRETSSIMTKHGITTHKSHMSREEALIAGPERGARPGAPTRAPGVASRHAPGLVFAPVRPGIVAACMVESPDSGRVPGADRPRWTGQSKSDKRNILPMTGKGSQECPALRNFRGVRTGRSPRPAVGYFE